MSCLKKVLKYFDKKKRKELTQSLILSGIKFNIEIWARETQYHGHIQLTINRIAREILDEAYDADVKIMLEKLKWSNVTNLYYEALIVNLRKLIMQRHAEKTYNLLNLQPSTYLTRFRELRLNWTVNTDNRYGKSSFIITAVKVYGDVKMHTFRDTSLSIFKNKLRSRVWSHYGNPNIRNKKKKFCP